MPKLLKANNLVNGKVLFKGNISPEDTDRIANELKLKSCGNDVIRMYSNADNSILVEEGHAVTCPTSQSDHVEKVLTELGCFDKNYSVESDPESMRFMIEALERQSKRKKAEGKEDKELEDLIKQIKDRYKNYKTFADGDTDPDVDGVPDETGFINPDTIKPQTEPDF